MKAPRIQVNFRIDVAASLAMFPPPEEQTNPRVSCYTSCCCSCYLDFTIKSVPTTRQTPHVMYVAYIATLGYIIIRCLSVQLNPCSYVK